MGSSFGSDFNFDFGVSFTPEEVANKHAFYNFVEQNPVASAREGVSVFYKDRAGIVFHTYSTYGRGVEVMMGTYNMLDLPPEGRNERDVEYKMEWVRHHDRYQAAPVAKAAPAAGSVEGLFDALKN